MSSRKISQPLSITHHRPCAVPDLGLRGQAQRDPAFRTIAIQPSGLTHYRPTPAQTVRPDLRGSRRHGLLPKPPDRGSVTRSA